MIAPFARIEKPPVLSGYATDDAFAAAADRRDGRPVDGVPGDGGGSLPGQGTGGSHGPSQPAQRTPQPQTAPTGDVARLLSLLADKTRLKILRILAGGERPVVALTSELRLPQPTVSHHLAWLRMMDLVASRRQGKHVFYTLGTSVECAADGTMTLRAADATVTIRSREGK